MTRAPLSDEDLILRLGEAEEQRLSGTPVDAELAEILADCDTLVSQVRQPTVPEPYAAEPELGQALDRACEIGQAPHTETVTVAQASTVNPQPPEKRGLGQYELLEQIGAGGMGLVYKALHRRLNRIVALKVLPPDRLPSREAMARFDREMRAVGTLHHPNIVLAQDAGEIDGVHFLVMEFVDGRDVASLVRQAGSLGMAEACEIARQAALGLQHLADQGLVHRDIKPSNLMLARSPLAGEPPTVKILDLGLAQFSSSETEAQRDITATGQVMGTVDYMAPEQGLNGASRLDIRTDLYSLGATLFKLLTGRAPFDDAKYNTPLKRLHALETESPPTLTERLPNCPPELAALMATLLAKSPQDRPSRPDKVAQALAPLARRADLHALLQLPPGSDTGTADMMSQTLSRSSTAPVDEIPQASASDQVAPQLVPDRTRAAWSPRGWLTVLGGVMASAMLFAVITVTTDQGTITIEAPDDLAEKINVSILRNGTPTETDFVIQRGQQEHRIRSGNIQVQLPAEVADQFEVLPQGELTVRRNHTVAFRLMRRSPVAPPTRPTSDPEEIPWEVAAANRVAAQWMLSIGGKMILELQRGINTEPKSGDLPTEPFQIGTVNLNGLKFDDQDLARFAGFQRLKTLLATDSSLTDAGLAALTDHGKNPPPLLKHLELIRTGISDVGIGYLSKCALIQRLDLDDTKFHDASLLRHFPKLKTVLLGTNDLEDAGVASLRELPLLEHLRINHQDWCVLLDHPDPVPEHFRVFDIIDPAGDFDVSRMERLLHVRNLYLTTQPAVINDGFWRRLGQMPRLEVLAVNAASTTATLTPDLRNVPARFEKLNKVNLMHLSLTGDFLHRLLTQSPNLTTLELNFSEISEEAYARLGQATQLTRLKVGGSNEFRDRIQGLANLLPKCIVSHNDVRLLPQTSKSDPAANRAAVEWVLSVGGQVSVDLKPGQKDVKRLEDLPNLPFEVSGVNLNHCRFENADLSKLAGLRSLGVFSAIDSNLDDTGLAALTDSGKNAPPRLGHIGAIRAPISEQGVAYLSRCTEMMRMDLDETRIRDLRPFSRFSKLSYLTILGCDLDDMSLENSLAGIQVPLHLGINVQDWNVLAGIPDAIPKQLVSLNLADQEGIFNAASLEAVPLLETLSLTTQSKVINDDFWRQLGRFPKLRQLVILRSIFEVLDLDLSRVDVKFASLESVQIYHSRVSGDFLDRLFQQSPKLKELMIGYAEVTDEAFARLAKAEQLEKLNLAGSEEARDRFLPLADALPKCEVHYNQERLLPQKTETEPKNP